MTLWIFVGDTLEWLETRKPSGIQRVTIELLSAALVDGKDRADFEVATCILAPGNGWLALARLRETLAYIASSMSDPGRFCIRNDDRGAIARIAGWLRPGLLFSQGSQASKPQPGGLVWPQGNDHVLFTGALWTPTYAALFRRLRAVDVDFSVFVHDLIPLKRPELVGKAHSAMFLDWLKTTVSTARIVFVSNPITRDQLVEWGAQTDADMRAHIVPIVFGTTHLDRHASSSVITADPMVHRVKMNAFVLCVGTIDKRKNQVLLLKVWSRLVSDLGDTRVPQLVLAGRNDLREVTSSTHFAPLFENNHVVILDDAPDQVIGRLYQASLFTVFPSYSEGYGLPVAESLRAGKLCITSELPAIRMLAGDLAWYFDPNIEQAAYERIRHAIEMPHLRAAAEDRIRDQFVPAPWSSAYRSILDAIAA